MKLIVTVKKLNKRRSVLKSLADNNIIGTVGTPDIKAKEHANNAGQMGLKIGYYHFCRPDKRNGGSVESDATAEADEALNIIAGLQKSDLPLVLDLEDQIIDINVLKDDSLFST